MQELGWDRPARKWQSVLEELWLSPPSSVPRWPVSKVNMDQYVMLASGVNLWVSFDERMLRFSKEPEI